MNVFYALALLALSFLYWNGAKMKNDNLNIKHFKPSEFGAWWFKMSSDQLLKLDKWRGLMPSNWRVMISPAIGALGRPISAGAPGEDSMHNVLKWKEVRATDVVVYKIENGKHLPLTNAEMRKAVALAEQAGFTGIGVYPHWKPYSGFHVDNRDGTHVARWGMIRDENGKQIEVSQADAMAKWV